jgi:short-subunit dehydrogenase involved in D-alanine esterification of teichoic acids
MLNNLKPYKPDSMWKSVRNKQRKAYAEALMDAYSQLSVIFDKTGFTEESYFATIDAILKRYDEVERNYEGS